jgi:hypothetical protein
LAAKAPLHEAPENIPSNIPHGKVTMIKSLKELSMIFRLYGLDPRVCASLFSLSLVRGYMSACMLLADILMLTMPDNVLELLKKNIDADIIMKPI